MPRQARLLFAFCLLPFALKSQERQFVFEHLRAVFVQPGAVCLDIDEQGRLWFGSIGRGVFSYDGYDFQNWKYDPSDSLTIGSDRIHAILADRKQRIWIGTRNSLNRLDRRTGLVQRWASVGDSLFQFHEFFEDRAGQIWISAPTKPINLLRFDEAANRFVSLPPVHGLAAQQIFDFAEDRSGQIWAGTNNGILRINQASGNYSKTDFSTEKELKTGKVNALFAHSDGKIWLGAEGGVFLFDPQNGHLERATLPDSLARWPVADLLFAEDGQFWFALRSRGLACWNPQTGAWRHFKFDATNPDGLPNQNILALKTDLFGNLWLGAGHGDFGRLNLRPQPVALWKIYPNNPEPRINSIYRIAEDRRGQLLVATTTKFYLIEKWGQPARPLQLDPIDPKSTIPYAFFTEKNGQLWAVDRFLLAWNAEKQRFERRFEKEMGALGPFLAIEQDAENDAVLWVGSEKGLTRFDRATGQAQLFEKINSPVFSKRVVEIKDDGCGHLWMNVDGGLSVFDKKTAGFSLFYSHSPAPRRLANNEILDITQGPDGRIWLSTMGGATIIDPATDRWENLTRREGLPDNVVMSVLFDRAENAWLNSTEHLICVSQATGSLKIIDKSTLLKAGSWTRGAVALADGRLLFSSGQGIVELHPNRIQLVENQEVATILLTRFEVGGQSFGARPGAFEFLKNVQLSASQNDVGFEWAGLQTALSSQLKYVLKLDGLHEKWLPAGSERQAVFANLSPGVYTFRVKIEGSNDPSKELAFHFVIAPPWWQTGWFRMLAGLLAVVAAVIFFKNRESQRLLRQQKELAEQNSRYKTRFLANVSHEIRTPMNAIVGLSRLLTEADLPPKPADYAEAIRQSSENLLVLINDVLDQAKIESGKFSFQHRAFDLSLIIRHLQNTLGLRATEKGLHFEVVFEENLPLQIVGDPVRLTQILTNLVGNAIKFTEVGGVKLTVSKLENDLKSTLFFEIQDSGIGIADERLERVFESFQQADDDIAATYGGTGLGLSITKELVEQQGGKIWLESDVGRGTTFFVELPFEADGAAQVVENQPLATFFEFPKLKILLVEDTFFNQMLAIELLESRLPGVEIVVAENGQIALEKLTPNGSKSSTGLDQEPSISENPQSVIRNPQSPFDLILMDVKMPVMDGLEATRRIRRLPDSRLCRVPIIGLTANAVAEELEKCRAAGMNAWVTKPIEADLLFGAMQRVLAG